ncbi:DUF1189 family protein [Candidatus Woesearchaeota archaeon]|nr:DUF1189 family protein [Candidatus Woesearchaeota archaeon]
MKKRAGKPRTEGKAAVQPNAVTKKDGMLKEFYKCLTSFSYYGKVKDNTAKRALSYLAILMLVFTLLPIIAGFTIIIMGASTLNIPEVRIQGGQASADVQQPYVIYGNGSETAVIIDTTGQTKDLDAYKTGALLTKAALIIKQEKQTRTTLLGLLLNQTFRAGLSYKELWIMGMYALTPLMVFGLLLDIVGISFIFRDTIIYLAYLVGAVSSASRG